MKLLFVIPVCNHDAQQAEKLLDFIHHHCGRKGELLLAMHADTHAEMKARLRISAALAFDTVRELEIRRLAGQNQPKFAQTNNMFRQVATHLDATSKHPFLWLEADCTPTTHDWRERLWQAYDEQSYPFFGSRMRMKGKGETPQDIHFMARVGIYPANAVSRISLEQNAPYEIASTQFQVAMGQTKLIQQCTIKSESDLISVREDAILVHGDKERHLLKQVESRPNGTPVAIKVTEGVESPRELTPVPELVAKLAKNVSTPKRSRASV